MDKKRGLRRGGPVISHQRGGRDSTARRKVPVASQATTSILDTREQESSFLPILELKNVMKTQRSGTREYCTRHVNMDEVEGKGGDLPRLKYPPKRGG